MMFEFGFFFFFFLWRKETIPGLTDENAYIELSSEVLDSKTGGLIPYIKMFIICQHQQYHAIVLARARLQDLFRHYA